MTPLTIFLVSCLVSGGLCLVLRGPLIRWKMLDRPVGRSSHSRTTVTAAGLAIILTTALQGLWWGWRSHNNMLVLLQVAMVVGAGVSFADDRRCLSIKLRLACHAFMALWGLAILQLRWQHAPHWISSLAGLWCGLLVMLWLVGYTNAFNFMDGIDGQIGRAHV